MTLFPLKQIILSIKLYLRMDQLLLSRLNKDEQVTRLDNLSPDKFGRSAFAKLSYTPSKLASNVIYKQVTQMKKTEQNGSKMRQYQSLNQILKDKIRNLQAEKAGIEQSLTQQIVMYKKMVAEMEEGLQQRVRELQLSFSEQIQRIIMDKQQEAKYVQSEKEMMQNRIYQLQNYIAELKEELNSRANTIEKKTQEYEKLEIIFHNSQGKIQSLEKKLSEVEVKAANDIEELNKKMQNQKMEYKERLQKMQYQKNKEKDQLQSQLRAGLQKIENQRNSELALKNQELKDLSAAFESQIKKINETISKKDEYIQTISKNLNDQKQKLLKITKQYTVEIANLSNDKKQIEQQCQTAFKTLEKERQQTKRIKTSSNQTTAYLEQEIEKLKKELELTQVDLLKERERYYYQSDELKRELLILRKNAQQNSRLMEENTVICKEIKNLKDLLMESSNEMERFKDEFIRLGADKDSLAMKLRELDMENETLHRINIQRQQEARTWRESYYKYRR